MTGSGWPTVRLGKVMKVGFQGRVYKNFVPNGVREINVNP